ncbi:MAG TPA: oligopeptide/dipeptide ABC transporter ATP-binding protein [Thermomicrobiales bacterium]|nr:oligopeptide/dipeptide ABC transporter ATP-binding protein [Thermomicrobiales bacterium]
MSETTPLLEAVALRRLFPLRRGLAELVLRRSHAIHAVDAVSFALLPGEILALVGESGCGKSTIGRLLVRLDTATAGSVRFRGRDVMDLDRAALKRFRRRAQIIFQNPFEAFDARQTIGAALHQALRIHDIGAPHERQGRIVAALEAAGIVPAGDFLVRYPHELSGGQLQRIVTVRAMLLEPDLLVADEPVSMLDVSVRAEILNQLLDLRDARQMAIVFITHDIAVARYVADRIAVMYLGAFAEVGPADDVIADPQHPYTQALLSHTLPVGDEDSGEPLEIPGDPPTPVDLGAGCRFAGRCPFAFDRCRQETPRLQSVARGHHVACHLIDG